MRRVVVSGLGAITPIGNSAGEAWESMKKGVCGIGRITRFDTTDYKTKVDAEVKGFDPSLYMDRQDIHRADLFTQYGVAAASQAVEDSRICGKVERERFGVYFGSGIGGILTYSEEQNKLISRGNRRVSPFLIPMMIANMAAAMIAIKHGCEGAVQPSVTACASSASAIGEAVRAIRHGYADAVISGGAEASICEIAVAGFSNMQALSSAEDPNAASLPFDRRHGGFVMGEGAAALLLEEYEHAKARGARIYGEVAGYGVSCDAYHITSPRPDAAGASRAMREAMAEAGYREGELVYLNAHGTGTPMNDKLETLAVKKTFGERAQEVLISSTKSMTGHMLGAAGAVEAIAGLYAMNEGILPPTIHLLEQDPECDLHYIPNTAIQASPSLVLSNSLGFGGHNVCLAFRRA